MLCNSTYVRGNFLIIVSQNKKKKSPIFSIKKDLFSFISLFFKADYFPFSKTIYYVILQNSYFSFEEEIGTPEHQMGENDKKKSVSDKGSFLKRVVSIGLEKSRLKMIIFLKLRALLFRKIFIKGRMKIDTFRSRALKKNLFQKNLLNFLQLGYENDFLGGAILILSSVEH